MTAAPIIPRPVTPEPEPDEPSETLAQTIREMVGEIYSARDLLVQMTLRDLRLRYKQSIMGFGWAILMPMLIVSAGCLVRGAMAHMAGTTLHPVDLANMVVKAVPWAFFVGAISFAVVSLTGNLNLVTKIYFPREVFPLSAVLTQAVDTAVGGFMVVVILLILRVPPTLQLLWVPPLLALLFLLTAGVCLLLACANLFFRDVKYIVQLLLNFGIFFTPVFFEPINLGAFAGGLMLLNPLTPILEGLRLSIVEHHSLWTALIATTTNGAEFTVWQPWYLLYSGATALIAFAGSWLLFHKLEFIYAEYI